MPDPDLVIAISILLTALPGVSEKRTEKHVTFFVRKKVFAFTRSTGKGVVMKLPSERIAGLLERDDIRLLTMGKRTMKEWVVLDHPRPSDYRKDLALFQEAIAFVSSGSKSATQARK